MPALARSARLARDLRQRGHEFDRPRKKHLPSTGTAVLCGDADHAGCTLRQVRLMRIERSFEATTPAGVRVQGQTLGIAIVVGLSLSGCASTQVLRDLQTDGCSLFPESDAAQTQRWSDCCIDHDMAYWRGGTSEERHSADLALRHCVLARGGGPALANLMYRGVRIGGMPLIPSPFRWGYGWGYGRGYEVLTPAERRHADELQAAYRRGHVEPSCRVDDRFEPARSP